MSQNYRPIDEKCEAEGIKSRKIGPAMEQFNFNDEIFITCSSYRVPGKVTPEVCDNLRLLGASLDMLKRADGVGHVLYFARRGLSGKIDYFSHDKTDDGEFVVIGYKPDTYMITKMNLIGDCSVAGTLMLDTTVALWNLRNVIDLDAILAEHGTVPEKFVVGGIEFKKQG